MRTTLFHRGNLSFLFLGSLVAVANAQYTEIDISGQTNADIQTYTNGANYQVGGTQLNVGSVPFGLALDQGQAGTTGVVQSAAGAYNFNFPLSGVSGGVIYTLINTAWGSYGTNEGQIVVTDSLGDTATLSLIEGDNIRDHNNDGFVNTLSDPTVVPTYFIGGSPNSYEAPGPVRLDMQTLILPSSFVGNTITNISFQGTAPGFPDGAAFLAGLTVGPSPVPEPSAITTTLIGLGVAGFFGKRRRR